MPFSKRLFLSLLIAPSLVATAHGVTLDWNTVTWTAGSLSNSYDVDAANTGNDVTVAVSGSSSQFINSAPAINSNLQGGFTTPPKALNLFVDFTSQTQSVTINVTLSAGYTQGAVGVSFTLFDVDATNGGGTSFQDQLSSIIGIAPDGSQVAATITTSATPAYTVTGTALTQVVTGTVNSNNTGPGSENGNVTISFAGPIKSFSFVYGSGTNTIADPTQQQISMGNFTFTPVPEINPAWSTIGSCLLAAVLILRHSAKYRK